MHYFGTHTTPEETERRCYATGTPPSLEEFAALTDELDAVREELANTQEAEQEARCDLARAAEQIEDGRQFLRELLDLVDRDDVCALDSRIGPAIATAWRWHSDVTP